MVLPPKVASPAAKLPPLKVESGQDCRGIICVIAQVLPSNVESGQILLESWLKFSNQKWNPGRAAGEELAVSLGFYHPKWNPASKGFGALILDHSGTSFGQLTHFQDFSIESPWSSPSLERTSERYFFTIPAPFLGSCLASRNFTSRTLEALRA